MKRKKWYWLFWTPVFQDQLIKNKIAQKVLDPNSVRQNDTSFFLHDYSSLYTWLFLTAFFHSQMIEKKKQKNKTALNVLNSHFHHSFDEAK